MTLHDVIGWVLHSPVRLVSVLVGLLVGAMLLLYVGHGNEAPHRPTAAQTRSGQSDRHGLRHASVETAGSAKPEPESRARTAVSRFLGGYLSNPHDGSHGIHPALKRYVTKALWRGLRLADPDQLPAGPVSSLDGTLVGDHLAVFRALIGDTRLDIEVVSTGSGWRVADVRPGRGR